MRRSLVLLHRVLVLLMLSTALSLYLWGECSPRPIVRKNFGPNVIPGAHARWEIGLYIQDGFIFLTQRNHSRFVFGQPDRTRFLAMFRTRGFGGPHIWVQSSRTPFPGPCTSFGCLCTARSVRLWYLDVVRAGVLYPAFYLIVSLFLFARRRRRRSRQHLCVRCCYNLYGNVSGICPECGTAIISHRP